MRTALYARVSSDAQRDAHTIDSQLEALSAFARQQGWPVEERHVYVDDGYSGYHFERPALDRLRDAARDGLLDLLLIHDPDRLARRYAYQVLLLEELERFGVEVRFLHQPPSDSPEQKLLVQVQGAISEYERARIMERTRRGRLFWARQGRPVSDKVPFGYRYVRSDGEPSVEVDEAAAPVVRRIFGWYAQGQLSYRKIALRLTGEGTPTPRGQGSSWDQTTVRAILRNDTYLGTWYLNRHRRERASALARPRRVERPRDEWIPIAVPPLLDPPLWSRAREIHEGGGPAHQFGPRPLTHPETHLLRRLVVCGPCRRKMTCLQSTTGKGYLYYWCRGGDVHRVGRPGNPCPHPTVLAPQLDEFVWSDVVALLTDPDLLRQAWTEQEAGTAGGPDKPPLETQPLDKQLTDLKRQRQRLVVAYQEGAIELEELTQRRKQLEEKLGETVRRLERLKVERRVHAELVDLGQNLKAICAALDEGLDAMTMTERMALCQRLIERVVVDGERAEIHYRFPVSSHCNQRGEPHQKMQTGESHRILPG
jgi:site-specific DNA recombinase